VIQETVSQPPAHEEPVNEAAFGARRPRGGPHFTTALFVLGFVLVAGALTHGLQLTEEGLAVRTLVGAGTRLLLAAGALAWAFARLHRQLGEDRVAPPEVAAEEPSHPAPRRRPWWSRWGRRAFTAGALVLAALAVASQWHTLRSAFSMFGHLRWRELRWAIYAEALSMVAFARVQHRLLKAGGVHLGLGSLIELTLAGNALSVTLPGGAAWSATFSFEQLRRRGANRAVAVYVLVAAGVVSTASLALILVVGVNLAGGVGPAAAFRVVANVIGIAVLAVAVGGVLLWHRPGVRAAAVRRLAALEGVRWAGRAAGLVEHVIGQLDRLRLTPGVVASIFLFGVFNWLADAACLAVSILAVGGHLPKRGLVVSYALAQIGASLPITPGGLGVVEGTLSVALVAYGMPASTAVAAVLLYRIISFWILVPIGWAAWGALMVQERRAGPRRAWLRPVA